MSNIQNLRSNTAGARPADNTQTIGTLYTNFADGQIGVIDATQKAMDLAAVRYHLDTAIYTTGDNVIVGGVIYRANTDIGTPEAFDPSKWDKIGTTIHGDLSGRDSADSHPIEAVTDLQSELDDRRRGKKLFIENVDLYVDKYLHVATLSSISSASLSGVLSSDFYSPAFNLNVFHVYNDVKYEFGLTHYTLATESQFDKLIFTQAVNGAPVNVYFRISKVHDTLIAANIAIDGSYTKTEESDSGLTLRGVLVDSVSNVKLEVDITSKDFRSTNVAPGTPKEDDLGNPVEDGAILSSLIDGTRSWKSIVGGTNVTVDNTDSANITISSTGGTTAGIITRGYYTGDTTDLDGTTYYQLKTDKGTVDDVVEQISISGGTDAPQTDFNRKILGVAHTDDYVIDIGNYTGNLTVSTSSNTGDLRFQVHVYKANGTDGTYDPVADLIAVADTGIIDIARNKETPLPYTAHVDTAVTITSSDIVIYVVSGGATAGNHTLKWYLGNLRDNYIDVPKKVNTDTVINKSNVIGATASDALNKLDTDKEGLLGLGTAGQVLATNAAADGKEWITVSGGSGGQVDEVVAGTNIAVDATDPAKPEVSVTGMDTAQWNANKLQGTDLDPTTVGSPSDDQVIMYTGGKWQAGFVPIDLSTHSIDGLKDVDTTTKTPELGQTLAWDGTNWVPFILPQSSAITIQDPIGGGAGGGGDNIPIGVMDLPVTFTKIIAHSVGCAVEFSINNLFNAPVEIAADAQKVWTDDSTDPDFKIDNPEVSAGTLIKFLAETATLAPSVTNYLNITLVFKIG